MESRKWSFSGSIWNIVRTLDCSAWINDEMYNRPDQVCVTPEFDGKTGKTSDMILANIFKLHIQLMHPYHLKAILIHMSITDP